MCTTRLRAAVWAWNIFFSPNLPVFSLCSTENTCLFIPACSQLWHIYMTLQYMFFQTCLCSALATLQTGQSEPNMHLDSTQKLVHQSTIHMFHFQAWESSTSMGQTVSVIHPLEPVRAKEGEAEVSEWSESFDTPSLFLPLRVGLVYVGNQIWG